MSVLRELPENPTQKLPREAYISEQWLERERINLFGKTWSFVGIVSDFKEPGDYKTVQAGHFSLIVLQNKDGDLQAFHNICRHRGTELLEGCGNSGKSIVCPYHNWAYSLDGTFRGMPRQPVCFPHVDKTKLNLLPASIGIFKDLVFAHPSEHPDESFENWLADVPDHAWPHDVSSSELREFSGEIVYEMKCNWKVFYENAIDGYHLAFLHKNTLGGPLPEKNVWEVRGRHLVWYSTEWDGHKSRVPKFVQDQYEKYGSKKITGAEEPGYGGVYMLFPTTAILTSAYSFSISNLEPLDANTTLLRIRSWSPKEMFGYDGKLGDIPGYDKESGRIKSSHWKVHPLETGDFQTEDVWVCEKMQRALHSPAHKVSELARGAGGEAALSFFQENILDFVPSGAMQVAAE